MGAEYTRQSTFTDGDIITAAHSNDEFNQLVNAFAASTGHTHDGTSAEGGPITKLLGTAITIGDGTAATDIAVTFDGETNDGVLTWKEDEDYFEFSDDILVASTEKLQFRDTAIYINSSTDGQLDLIADGAVLVDTAGDITLDADGGDVFFKDGGTTYGSLTNTSGNLIIKSGTTTAVTFSGANATVAGNLTVDGNFDVTGTLDFSDSAITNVGSIQLDSIAGDEDSDTSITFSGSNVITIANAGTNQVTFNDGSIAPVTDDDVDLGTSSLKFKDLYIDGITYTDAITLNGTAITSTGAELNILDGVTSTASELNLVDGSSAGTIVNSKAVIYGSSGEVNATTLQIGGTSITSTAAELNILDGVTSTAGELNLVDGSSAGTIVNSKAVIYGSSGEVNATTLQVGGTAITSTPTELNLLDGSAKSTSSITIADADAFIVIDGNTTKQIPASDLTTYISASVGDINSVVAGVGLSGGGTSGDVTLTLDLSELSDVTPVNGDKLATLDSDGSTEQLTTIASLATLFAGTGLSATNSVMSIEAAQTGITSLLATDIKIGEDNETKIDFETPNEIHFYANNAEQVYVSDGVFGPQTDSDVDLGTTSVRWKDAYIDTITTTGNVTIGGDLTVSGDDITMGTNTSGHIMVADGTNFNPVAVSGDVTIDSTGAVTIAATSVENSMLAGSIADTKLNTISTADKVSLSALDIDGGSDINADLTTSDLIVVDDGAGGTNRKAALSRLTTFMQGQGFSSEDPTALAIALG